MLPKPNSLREPHLPEAEAEAGELLHGGRGRQLSGRRRVGVGTSEETPERQRLTQRNLAAMEELRAPSRWRRRRPLGAGALCPQRALRVPTPTVGDRHARRPSWAEPGVGGRSPRPRSAPHPPGSSPRAPARRATAPAPGPPPLLGGARGGRSRGRPDSGLGGRHSPEPGLGLTSPGRASVPVAPGWCARGAALGRWAPAVRPGRPRPGSWRSGARRG